MTTATAGRDGTGVLDAVRELAPTIAGRAAEIERPGGCRPTCSTS